MTDVGDTMLSDDAAIAQYKRDGYYVARDVLSKADVRRVFTDVHALAAQQLSHRGLVISEGSSDAAIHADLQRLFAHDLKAYLATLALGAKLVSMYQLFMDAAIRRFVSRLGFGLHVWQGAPIFHLMSSSLRVPDGYYGYDVHQDWPILQSGLDSVTAWVPFVDVDRKMYTMDVLPESHKKGLYPFTRKPHAIVVNAGSYDPAKFVPIEANVGDVVFVSCFTVHRSSVEGDERLRVSASLRYENAAEPSFIARGYPSAQKRTIINDLITPNFPTEKAVSDCYK